MKTPSSFPQTQVVSTLCKFTSSVEHKRGEGGREGGRGGGGGGGLLTSIAAIVFPYYRSQWRPSTVWLFIFTSIFFKIIYLLLSSVEKRKRKLLQFLSK